MKQLLREKPSVAGEPQGKPHGNGVSILASRLVPVPAATGLGPSFDGTQSQLDVFQNKKTIGLLVGGGVH